MSENIINGPQSLVRHPHLLSTHVSTHMSPTSSQERGDKLHDHLRVQHPCQMKSTVSTNISPHDVCFLVACLRHTPPLCSLDRLPLKPLTEVATLRMLLSASVRGWSITYPVRGFTDA